MNAKEFAEQNADHIIMITGEDLPFGGSGPNPRARVVGYNQDDLTSLVIEFEDEQDRIASWPIESNPFTMVVDAATFKDPPLAWSVSLNELEYVGPRGKGNGKIYFSKAYPNKCKTCRSMARKINGAIYCSNLRCKSRVKLPKLPDKQKVRLLRCPTCRGKAAYCMPQKNRVGEVIQVLQCMTGHKWEHTLAVNDILSKTLAPGNKTDAIYTLAGWLNY